MWNQLAIAPPVSAALHIETYPVREFSKRQIVGAGRILRERIPVGEPPGEGLVEAVERFDMSIIEAFRIAHNWRDAHMRPMFLARNQLAAKLRNMGCESVTAARLKRMNSIRRKMWTRPITLYQMQDIAGCRAIVDNCNDVAQLARFYDQHQRKHLIVDVDDYISAPKIDGYRSHHVILKFRGEGEDAIYNRQNVEIQIRSKAQHSWATAVEAIGLINHQNIKGGGGSVQWRRFFELMSSEIAYEEGMPPCPSASGDRKLVREELREVSNELGAVSMLETLNRSVLRYGMWGTSGARYFLLQFDYNTQEVTVEPFFEFSRGSERYVDAEAHQTDRNSVLVEVNGIDELKAAFPNYFLDVQAFTQRLQAAIAPRTQSRNPVVRKAAEKKWDISWIRDWQAFRRNRRKGR